MPSETVGEREFLTGLPRRVVVQARKLNDEKKRRRFLCEFVRPHFSVFKKAILPRVIELIERGIDGTGNEQHYARALGLIIAHSWKDESLPLTDLTYDLVACIRAIPVQPDSLKDDLLPMLRDTERQAAILRDIFGNPFRPVSIEPAWLTSTVLALARGIYKERLFDRMPILADALEEAGCDRAEILNHCREPADHVRGCWVVDLVLGKA